MQHTEAFLIGLSMALTKVLVMAVQQGALNRELTILDLESYASELGDKPEDQTAKMWVRGLVAALTADPSRPPAAPVLRLFPSEGNKG